MRREVGVRGRGPCNGPCITAPSSGDWGRARYLARMVRLSVGLALLVALFAAGPAAATAPPPEAPAVAPPTVVPAQTDTTPEDPDEDDPDEEEIGKEFEDAEPEQGEAPEEEAAPAPPAPAPAPAPTAPAELPRTGADQRLLLAAALMVLTGFALRRVVRPR